MKDKYISPECEIITFSAEDIINTSTLTPMDSDLEEDDMVQFSYEHFR